MRRRAVALASVLALAASACSWFEDPIEPWQRDIIYEERAGAVVAVPETLTVDAPFGFILLTNDTTRLRGFAIDELAVYERIRPEGQVRIRVEEARDRRTYVFYDHVHPGTIRGTIVTRFVAEEER